jgi:ORF6N domain
MASKALTRTAANRVAVPVELIQRRIYVVRGQKVMLDRDLSELYGVPTKALNQAVKRNLERFPQDFMFQLLVEEAENVRSQIVTGGLNHRDPRFLPYAFTEHGVAMLSSVLNSRRAVQMNIFIVRVFMRLREVLATNKGLARRIDQLDATQKDHANLLALIVKDVQNIAKSTQNEFKKLQAPRRRKARIGFKVG